MRVLHILAQLPQRTGSGVYFTNLVEGLKEYAEIDQACLYGTTNDYDISILDKNKQYEVIFETEKMPFPIAGMSDVMPYKNTVYSEMTEEMLDIWQKNFTEQLLLAKAQFNPDVIITHHLWILSSMVCKIFSDKKIIAVCHNTDIRQAEKHPNMQEKYVTHINRADKILSLSDNQIDDIVRVYNYDRDKIINIGAGYSEKVFYPLEQYVAKDKVEIVYAGKFDESKGFYELIKAFNELSKKREDVTLDLIGAIRDDNKERIAELTKDTKNLKIYNVNSQKALADVMRTKDIFVLPSYFEGLGLIAVEALGSGLRAVTTNIDGLMELLGDKVNSSEVIEYVTMPTIYDTDKAVEEEKPDFVNRLVKALELQIERTKQNRPLPQNIFEEILKHSWQEKIKNIYNILK